MADFEIHINLEGHTRPIGLARSNRVRGGEAILFEYDGTWLEDPDAFSLEPALALGRGAFAPPAGIATFGSIGDSAPDAWGRRLMQRLLDTGPGGSTVGRFDPGGGLLDPRAQCFLCRLQRRCPQPD